MPDNNHIWCTAKYADAELRNVVTFLHVLLDLLHFAITRQQAYLSSNVIQSGIDGY